MGLVGSQIMKAGVALFVLMSLAPLAGCIGATELDRGKILAPGLLDRLAQGEVAVDVIVLLTGYQGYIGRIDAGDPSQMVAIRTEIASRQAAVLDRLDSSQFEVKHRFENILGFSGRATEAGIRALEAMPEVHLIEEDGIAEVQAGSAGTEVLE